MKIPLLLSFFFLAILPQVLSTNYQFYGYTNDVYSEPTNWAWTGYPGTTFNSGDFGRFTSNFSAGKCSLDVDIINNGRMLLDSKFYYNGHTITNNNLLETTGTIWGDVTSEATGTLSPGWDIIFWTKAASINGSLTSSGKIVMDFDGDDNSHDSYLVSTTATISGSLEIRFQNNFVPTLNSPYTIINATTNLTGTFSTVTFPTGVMGNLTYTASHDVQVTFTFLPVELFDFDAMLGNGQVNLYWKTASETNNSHFDIEHATDGRHFQKIGSRVGAGNPTEFNVYTYTHYAPQDGSNYYRLKQVDFDGRFEFSKTLRVELNPTLQFHFFPNPVSDIIHLKFHEELNQNIQLKIIDLKGRIVYAKFLNAEEIEFDIDLNFIPTGNYFLEINKEGKIYLKKIIKK